MTRALRQSGVSPWFDRNEEPLPKARAIANWGFEIGERAAVYLELGSVKAFTAALVSLLTR